MINIGLKSGLLIVFNSDRFLLMIDSKIRYLSCFFFGKKYHLSTSHLSCDFKSQRNLCKSHKLHKTFSINFIFCCETIRGQKKQNSASQFITSMDTNDKFIIRHFFSFVHESGRRTAARYRKGDLWNMTRGTQQIV